MQWRTGIVRDISPCNRLSCHRSAQNRRCAVPPGPLCNSVALRLRVLRYSSRKTAPSSAQTGPERITSSRLAADAAANFGSSSNSQRLIERVWYWRKFRQFDVLQLDPPLLPAAIC